MNKNERLQLYWDLYFIAVGISTMWGNKYEDDYVHPPYGLCSSLWEGWKIYGTNHLPELQEQFKSFWFDTYYWHPPGDWKPRAKDLLEAIKLCS